MKIKFENLKIGNNKKVKASKLIYMRIGEIASSAKYRMDEQFQNSPIFVAKIWFFKLEIFLYKIFNFPI